MTDRQHRRPAAGICWPAAVAAAALACPGPRPLQAQQPPSPVVVSELAEREVAAGQTFVGTVEPLKTAIVGSAVAGRVVDFPVNKGDRVAAGGTLAQLLTETIKLQLKAAKAELELRRQELRELENGTRPEDIRQARAAMLAAESQRDYLQQRSKRLEELGTSAAREEREQAAAEARTAAQRHLQAEAAYQLAEKGAREEAVAQAQARRAFQKAQVDLLRDRIRKYTVISRFDGYVTAEHTEVGEWLQVGDPVAEVAALDRVEVIAQVVENHVPFIRLGASVRVEIPALPDKVFTGVVSSVAPQGDIRARTFPVHVLVDNEIVDDRPAIKGGMFARVMLPTGDRQPALLTPKDAIVLGGQQPLVFVVAKQQGQTVARPVPVRLGVAAGTLIQVIGELSADDQIIVEGNERVRPEQPVTVVRVDPPPEEEPPPEEPSAALPPNQPSPAPDAAP